MSSNKWRTNPYDGDIYPGEDVKLYRDATKEVEEEKRFSLTDSDPRAIRDALEEVAGRYCWHRVTTVPMNFDTDGTRGCLLENLKC